MGKCRGRSGEGDRQQRIRRSYQELIDSAVQKGEGEGGQRREGEARTRGTKERKSSHPQIIGNLYRVQRCWIDLDCSGGKSPKGSFLGSKNLITS